MEGPTRLPIPKHTPMTEKPMNWCSFPHTSPSIVRAIGTLPEKMPLRGDDREKKRREQWEREMVRVLHQIARLLLLAAAARTRGIGAKTPSHSSSKSQSRRA